MKAIDEATRTKNEERSAQLRLALIELGRIEREIAALEARPLDPREQDLLTSLRCCRASLLRMYGVQTQQPIGRRSAD